MHQSSAHKCKYTDTQKDASARVNAEMHGGIGYRQHGTAHNTCKKKKTNHAMPESRKGQALSSQLPASACFFKRLLRAPAASAANRDVYGILIDR